MNVDTNELPKNSEQWASIDGYKNYQVSWWGRVRNAKTGRILKTSLSTSGYSKLDLYKKGVQKTHYIHQLVAREWVPNTECKMCVDHIDGSRTNNHYENLRWATNSENSFNMKKHIDGSSVYKGVSYYKPSRKWKTQITVNGKVKYLGLYTNEREAAEAYNAAAVEYYKKIARLNTFID